MINRPFLSFPKASDAISSMDTAHALQKLAVPAELCAITIVYRIFNQPLFEWYILAMALTLGRLGIYFITDKAKPYPYFILSNLLSMIVWVAYGVICSKMNDFNVLVATLMLTGLVSGALLFLTYIKYLFILYSTVILGAFALALMFKGGIFITIGGGIIILVIFLSSLSFQYYNLTSAYFNTARINSLLYEEEQMQVEKLACLKSRLYQKCLDRKKIEEQLVRSNDLLQKSIYMFILEDEALKEEILAIYQNADQGILLMDEGSDAMIVNPYFSVLWGIEKNTQFTKKELHYLLSRSIDSDDHVFLNTLLFPKKQFSSHRIFELSLNDERVIKAEMTVFKTQKIVKNLWVFKDITEKHLNQSSLSLLNQFDSLTQIPSRRLIYEKLHELTKEYQNSDLNFALAFIDINDFKLVNDCLGHSVGNQVIKAFADRLRNNIRSIDFAGRYGGDEFICIFTELTYKVDVDPLIKDLKSSLEEPLNIDNNTMIINASFGVSFYPCDTSSLDELISFADIAMYRAKENTNCLYERFLPQYTQFVNEKHVVGQELKSALIMNAFYLVFQPIYETKNQSIAKVEVLLRWREQVSPSVFIPLAEQFGLINDIGLWVLEETCKARYELSKMPQLSSDQIKFCINISSRQIQTPKQINNLLEVVRRSSCKPEWLEFELTESTLVDLDKAVYFISTVRAMGISVAIDDFGTGFSSLSYLKNLYFDVIKIDKHFLANIFDVPREMDIFRAIIHLAHMLKSQITVEGVETKEQYAFCVEAQAQFIQGFYMARPMDFKSLIEWIS